MSLPEFYAAIAQEVNDSDVPLVLGIWEVQPPSTQEYFGLLYCMVVNGVFDGISRKKRATKRYQSKLP